MSAGVVSGHVVLIAMLETGNSLGSTMRRAKALLETLRQTPMRRGAISKRRLHLKEDISSVIEAQGIHPALAQRIAFQLIFKFDDGELGDRAVWSATGRLLHQEATRLKAHIGLAVLLALGIVMKVARESVKKRRACRGTTGARR
jgi:hypothetical protein